MRPWIAFFNWALVGLLLAAAIGSVSLALLNTMGGDADRGSLVVAVLFLALIAMFATVGALVVAHQPGNAVGWLFGALAVSFALVAFFGEYVDYAVVNRLGALPRGDIAAWAGSWLGGGTAFAPLALVLLLFPDGRLPSRRWRSTAWLVGLSLGFSLLGSFAPGPLPNLEQSVAIDNPFGIAGGRGVLGVVNVAGFGMLLAALIVAASSLVWRFRKAAGTERSQIKWLALAGVTVIVYLILVPMLDVVAEPSGHLAGALFTIAFVPFPVAVGIAILRHRLYDIDLLLNRTLVYGALTVGVVGGYALIVAGLGTLLQSQGSFAVSVVAAGVVAVLFQPLREQIQTAANRLLYGDRDDPYAALSRLGHRLEQALAPEAVLPAVVQGVAEALRLPYAAIALPDGAASTVVAATGSPVANPVRLPLTYGAEPAGELLLATRGPGESFGPRDLRLLDDLARQIGVAAHAVRLTADLQEARERLVTAREEERRRLRRDLHDGLGAQLAALSVQTGVVRSLIGRNPSAAEAATVELGTELRAAVADIRRLVHGLRPPALDELGLAGAIRQRAARFAGEGLPTTEGEAGEHHRPIEFVVRMPDGLPEMPAAVEVAVYRIVEEALANVVRHAQASRCAVHLEVGPDLCLTIEDDGVGLAGVRAEAGIGMASMRERATELGGSCVVGAAPVEGTRVVVRLPLPSQRKG